VFESTAELSQRLPSRKVVHVRATEKSTQLSTEDAPSRQVNVEVAGVVRQPHLLDERADVEVDVVATPGRVAGVVLHVWIALGEVERQRVADGDR